MFTKIWVLVLNVPNLNIFYNIIPIKMYYIFTLNLDNAVELCLIWFRHDFFVERMVEERSRWSRNVLIKEIAMSIN